LRAQHQAVKVEKQSEPSGLLAGTLEKQFSRILGFLKLTSACMMAYFVAFHLSNAFNLALNAHDYGIQVGAARNAIFHGNFYCDVINMNYLGDHFSPSLILLGPVLLISDHPFWILLIQNLLMLASFYWAFRVFRLYLGKIASWFVSLTLVANVYFLEIFRHDFHVEALGLLLFLVLMHQLVSGKRDAKVFYPVLILLLGVKEDVALVLTGVFAFQFLRKFKREDLLLTLGCLVYFVLTMRFFMPFFSDGVYTHMGRYQSLGNSPEEVIRNFFVEPWRFLAVIKWDSVNTLLKSFYYLPLLGFIEFLPALIPIYFNNASDYYLQSNFWWVHSYLILPILIAASGDGLRLLGNLIEGKYFKLDISKLFPGAFSEGFQLTSKAKELLVFRIWALLNRLPKSSWIWLFFLIFIITSLFPRYKALLNDSYSFQSVSNKWETNTQVVNALQERIKTKIPASSRIASCGELQPHLLGYSYSGFLGLPQWDSLTFVNSDYLIFLEDRTPWPFGDSTAYAKYKQTRLEAFAPFYKDELFLVLKKKDVQARP